MLSLTVDGVTKLLGHLVPAHCALCRESIARGEICGRCAASLPWIDHCCQGCAMPVADAGVGLCVTCARHGPAFDRAWAAFRLAAPIQRLIHRLKYEADFAAARLLGVLASRKLSMRPEPIPQLLIPVPLHRGRLRQRGYNQAAQVALAIQSVLAVPLASPHVAIRIRATGDQIGQSAAHRRSNLEGAFHLQEPLTGSVALIDDVMTTGATLASLARACRAAGATRVEAWAIARAI